VFMIPEVIGFRPNEVDKRILEGSGDSTTNTIRRALRLLDHDEWMKQAMEDAWRIKGENLNDEPDAW